MYHTHTHTQPRTQSRGRVGLYGAQRPPLRIVRLHYNWKYEFLRATIAAVVERYKVMEVRC